MTQETMAPLPTLPAPWVQGEYLIATNSRGAVYEDGWTYGGLGVALRLVASRNGKRPARWVVTHLGTGGVVLRLSSDDPAPILAKFVALTDWTAFKTPSGWKKTDPELMEKVQRFYDACPDIDPTRGPPMTARGARQVAEARA